MEQQVHAFITGLVQGVGYRIWVKTQADKLNLRGWARNLPNGKVETVFQGKPSAIERMLKLCHQGPTFAQVEQVESIGETLEHFNGFEILSTPRT